MPLVGRIYRPPSEADSLLLQVTVGCSHNRCTYCAMYADPEQRFRVKPVDEVAADIAEAADGPPPRRVFLCDGDALVLSTDRLADILTRIRGALRSVRRVGLYGDARSILRKTPDELARLRDLGLGIVYHGVESGDEETLRRVRKGSTAIEAAEAGRRLKAAGIRHSVIVMLGLGGTERAAEHAAATAELLTELDPPYVGALTTTVLPGTDLAAAAERGEFELPDPWAILGELETLVGRARFSRCTFHANHASNHLPLRLNLPVDRERGLRILGEARRRRDPSLLVPAYMRGI